MKHSFVSFASLAIVLPLCACGSSQDPSGDPSGEPTAGPTLAIVAVSGAPLRTVAGDGLALKVVERESNGTLLELPAGATVIWTAPSALATLPPESTDSSPIPPPVAQPTVAWISNPSRPDRAADLANVLFVLDPGTVQNASVQVSATLTGVAIGDSVTAEVAVDPTPGGDWTRGESLYGAGGANCAQCHGATGHGSPGAPEATSYVMAGGTYDFPAPGLNAEPGNAANDPAWNAALFAVAARADMDNGGIALRAPMPDWLASPNPATGKPLATQDLADIYAFLKTQTH